MGSGMRTGGDSYLLQYGPWTGPWDVFFSKDPVHFRFPQRLAPSLPLPAEEESGKTSLNRSRLTPENVD